VADETRTSRDVIRAAAEAYFREGHGEWLANLDDLAERIDRALFESEDQERFAARAAISSVLALAIGQLRELDRRMARDGFQVYSDPLRGALGELEHVRQLLADTQAVQSTGPGR
jgi:hypothetical protein